MISLYSDEVIFRMQRAGGVSVYCGELLSRAMKDPDVEVRLLDSGSNIDNLVYREKNLSSIRSINERSSNLMAQRVFEADLSEGEKGRPIVFHGTYFRTAKNRDVVNILTVHDFTHQKYYSGTSRFLNNILKRKTIARADAVICISENTKRDLLSFYPDFGNKRVSVIYNGASSDYHPLSRDTKLSDRFDVLQEYPFLLYVGARASYKNFGFMITLIKQLPNIKLAVIGSPLTEEEIDMLGEAADRTYCFSGLPNDELNTLYNKALAFVYPSLYEGFGIPVLEAMKAGCPVIAFNNSSIPEVLRGTGFLLRNNDIAAAENTVRRLLEDSNLRESMSMEQIEASSFFSWDSCYDHVKSLYFETIESLSRMGHR